MKRMLLIINPISGTHDKTGLDREIQQNLAEADIEVTIAPTQYSGHATELARRAIADGYDAVLACGGDGTINETAVAMIGSGVAMGVIPAGSGNGLARHLEIPVDTHRSLDIIKNGEVLDCDYGTVNERPFFCTFGIGYDAAVSDRFAASGHRGKMSYLKSAVEEFMRFKHDRYTISADGEIITDDAFLVACCNASQYGNNAYIAPAASITDGLLDLIVVRKASIIETAMLGVDLMAGTLAQNRLIDTYKVKNAVIVRSEDGPAHIDGEPISLGKQMQVECHPGKLRIFVPADRSDFRPLITPAEDLLRDITLTIENLFR